MSSSFHSGITAQIDDYDVETIEGKATVVYNVHLHSERSGMEWDVRRRFSEFRENFISMQQVHPSSPVHDFPFPRRTLLHIRGEHLAEERRKTLQKYLELVLEMAPPPMLVAAFLRITPERFAKKKNVLLTESEEGDGDERTIAPFPATPETGGSRVKFSSEDELDFSGESPHLSQHDLSNSQQQPEAGPEMSIKRPTGRIQSLRIVEDEANKDEDGLDDNDSHHHHGIPSAVLVKMLFVLASASMLRMGLMLVHALIKGEDFTLTGLVKFIFDSIIRHKEDVFLVAKTVIFIVVCGIYAHRVLGFAVGVWLRSILSTPKGGFLMYFDWISLRIGYDHNEIVVHGFEWRNPPKYQVERSRYFLYASKVSLHFDLQSLIDSVLKRKDHLGNPCSLRVWALEIDGLVARIERGKRKKDGLNLWAALGADNEAKANEVEKGVKAGLSKAAKDVGEGLAVAGHKVGEGLAVAGGAVVGGVKTVGKGFLKYNPVSVIARALSDKDKLKGGQEGADGSTASEAPVVVGMSESNHDDEDNFHEVDPVALELRGEEETWHDGGGAGSDSSKVVDKGEGMSIGTVAIEQDQSKSQKRSSLFSGKRFSEAAPVPPPKTVAWGVPFKIECDRFTGRNLEFHVQDFLNASHVEDKPIIIPLMDMDRRELTTRGRRGPLNPGGYRQPVWLDDLTWKIVNRLIADLLKTNSFSLISTVAASGANNAVTGIVEGSHVASVGAAEGLYSYNPKDILAGVGRGLSRLANHNKVSFHHFLVD